MTEAPRLARPQLLRGDNAPSHVDPRVSMVLAVLGGRSVEDVAREWLEGMAANDSPTQTCRIGPAHRPRSWCARRRKVAHAGAAPSAKHTSSWKRSPASSFSGGVSVSVCCPASLNAQSRKPSIERQRTRPSPELGLGTSPRARAAS